jgi:hypothetical protein
MIHMGNSQDRIGRLPAFLRYENISTRIDTQLEIGTSMCPSLNPGHNQVFMATSRR